MRIQGEMYRWKIPVAHDEARSLAVDLNMTHPVATILWNRGYTSKQAVQEFK